MWAAMNGAKVISGAAGGGLADVVVLGAGAAGLMCARTAARRGRRVLLLEHQREPGRKILISGGGRCNFTNLETGPDDYLSQNPHFARSALSRFRPEDFLKLMAEHGLTWNEKEAGQLFCDQGAKAVRDMLLAECRAAGVSLRTGVMVGQVERVEDGFAVDIPSGTIRARSLVVATGGLSIPKLGATPFGYRLAERFGLPLVPPRAGLVPFTFAPREREVWGELAGISTHVSLSCGGITFTGPVLFTHRGLSGPAALNASSYWREGQALVIDLFPGMDLYKRLKEARARRPKAALRTVLGEELPRRLARHLCGHLVSDGQLGRLPDAALRGTAEALGGWRVTPAGTEGYRTAEVTVGGVDTRALSSKTMMTSDVPGLFFIGEVVDVTGRLGGFNFQWAWASGHAAGEVA